nr:hypothetical protein [Tanacetum cinerariifolium]
ALYQLTHLLEAGASGYARLASGFKLGAGRAHDDAALVVLDGGGQNLGG